MGRPTNELGAGEPVLVTRNDYRLGLFNGDSGVVIATEGDDESDGGLRVAIGAERGITLFPLRSLRGTIELGSAITIHRSQGSEYLDVAVVLPPSGPILSRELVYTAITRARRSVTLLGASAAYQSAIRRPTQRYSGIAAELLRDV